MPNNLPPGVTPSMLPGNRPEDTKHEALLDFNETAIGLFYMAHLAIRDKVREMRRARPPLYADDIEHFMTEISAITERLEEQISNLIIDSIADEPDPDHNPHEMED